MNELLNCNVGCIFLTMGLPTLDPVMTSVLDYIHQHHNVHSMLLV